MSQNQRISVPVEWTTVGWIMATPLPKHRWGNSGNSDRLYFGGGAPKSLQMVTAVMKLKDACPLEEKL